MQEDAHEFLECLLESCARRLVECGIGGGGGGGGGRLAPDTTAIHCLFGGYLRDDLECPRCGYIQSNYDCFTCLSLPLRLGPAITSVEDLLTDFSATRSLDYANRWTCRRCGHCVHARTSLRIETVRRTRWRRTRWKRTGRRGEHGRDSHLDPHRGTHEIPRSRHRRRPRASPYTCHASVATRTPRRSCRATSTLTSPWTLRRQCLWRPKRNLTACARWSSMMGTLPWKGTTTRMPGLRKVAGTA